MKAQENQTDSVAKLVKDLIVRKAVLWVKAAAPVIGLVLLLLVLLVAVVAVPVIAAIAILYNSPFALFLPPLESGDTVQTVTSAYVEPELLKAKGYDSYQFVRNGFFCADIHDSREGAPVFNRIVSLKSSFKLPKA